MKDFEIELYLPEAHKRVTLNVKATDQESADNLAEGLANTMTGEDVLCDFGNKNDPDYYHQYWQGTAKELVESQEKQL